MTDLQMLRLCCEAMGFKHYTSKIGVLFAKDYFPGNVQPRDYPYNPLVNGEQALSLIKHLKLCVSWDSRQDMWTVGYHVYAHHRELNRAVCECVAKMESDRQFDQPHHGH